MKKNEDSLNASLACYCWTNLFIKNEIIYIYKLNYQHLQNIWISYIVSCVITCLRHTSLKTMRHPILLAWQSPHAMCLASQVLWANAHLLLEQNLLNPGTFKWKYITFSQNILVSEEQHIHLFGQPAGASSLWIEHLLPAEVLLQHGNTKTRTAKQSLINTLAKVKSNK